MYMSKQPFHLLVFLGVLIGALVGTLVVPGIGTTVGVVAGGLIGLVLSHRKKQPPTSEPPVPPRM